jgi:P27 family predicted phage terminase small subunit
MTHPSNGPAWLDAAARAIWHAVAPDLHSAGLLLPSEEFTLARYCDYASRWMKLRAAVNREGETYETESKHGSLRRQNPDFKSMLDLEGEMTAIEDRFALTPVMRFKLKAIRANVDPDPKLALFAPAAAATPADQPATPFGILN